jgi:RHS repeat-associated protein
VFQTDHHGSVIEQPANPAVIDAPTSFDPFGQPDTAVADHQPGYRAEATTAGLIHLRNRDYDPTTGQFLTPDPLDGVNGTPTVANTHHYTNNDPLNLTDPLGLRARDGSLIRFDAWGYPLQNVPECRTTSMRVSTMRGHDSAVLGGSQVVNDLLGRYGWETGPNHGLGPVGQGYYPMIDLSGANGPCVAYVPRPPDDFNPRLFLDLLGFVPVIGDVVDGGLCVWDGSAAAFTDGSTTNAAISCLAIIPFIGSFGKLGKWIPTPRALAGPRQVDAAWGPARTYKHGTGPMTAIEHINYRHAFNSGFDDVSRFAQGTSARQIQGYVDDALRYGNVTQNGASITYDVGRTVGFDQAGNAVTGIQVWVRDGYIRTAYPVAAP